MTALVDVTKSCLDSITQTADHLEGAIMYLDSGCTESFQFAGAFPVLLDLGVRAVCSLENMSSLDAVVNWNSNNDVARKIVVFTSRFLSDAHRYIMRCLSTHENVQKCTIYTSMSETSHSAYPDSPLGPDAYREYESLLLQDFEELVKSSGKKSEYSEGVKFPESSSFEKNGWAQLTDEEDASHLDARSSGRETESIGPKLVVSVHHFPVLLCPLSRRVFVLPSEGSVAEASLSAANEDSLSPGLPAISTGMPADSEDVPPGALLTAHFLYHLAAKMDLKLEIFSLGDLSKSVGKIMTDMSSLYDVGRRKRSAGLLIVDRTLDLLTPCFHADSLVDRMFSALPRRERVSHSHVKESQSQVRLRSSSLQRAPLDVKIPLAELLSEEIKESQLVERIEAFLDGWDNAQKSTLPGANVANICSKIGDEKLLSRVAQMLNGSFVSTESFRGTAFVEAILERRTKDGALLVKRWLQETLNREKISLGARTRAGFASSEVKAMVKALAKSQSSLVRNKGIILLAAAAISAFEASFSARWDAFISAEKILNASAEDTSQNLAAQIVDLINKSGLTAPNGGNDSSQGLLSFQDALLLMIAGYMLAGENFPTSGSGGPFSWQEEHLMKEAVVEVILEKAPVAKLKFLDGLKEALEANLNRKRSKEAAESSEDHIDLDDLDDDQWGKWGDEEDEEAMDKNNKEQLYDDMQLKLELRDKVDNFFKFLHKLSTVRRKSAPLNDGAFSSGSNFGGEMELNKGLLYKVLTRVLSKSDITGMEYHSSTVGRLFKSSFGRFVGQTKPNLGDQNVIMVFVVGGINAVEVLEAQEALSESERPDVELILGGTTILTPDDMFDLLIGESSYL